MGFSSSTQRKDLDSLPCRQKPALPLLPVAQEPGSPSNPQRFLVFQELV